LAASVLVASAAQAQAMARETRCENSTVADAWGPKIAEHAKSFLAELQQAIKNNDAAKVARLVCYPVRINGEKRQFKISRQPDFIQSYSSVITPKVAKAILAQSADCLFGTIRE
jgi:hypothetical protein